MYFDKFKKTEASRLHMSLFYNKIFEKQIYFNLMPEAILTQMTFKVIETFLHMFHVIL